MLSYGNQGADTEEATQVGKCADTQLIEVNKGVIIKRKRS